MKYRILFNIEESPAAVATAESFRGAGHVVKNWAGMDEQEQAEFLAGGIDILVLSMETAKRTGTSVEEKVEEALAVVDGEMTQNKEDSSAAAQGLTILDGLNYQLLADELHGRTLSLLNFVEKISPYMSANGLLRIAYLTEEKFSIRNTGECGNYGEQMAAAANHMMLKVLFNILRPEGFTFRITTWQPGDTGIPAWKYILRNQSYISTDPYCHSEENRLVMKDGMLREIPW